MPREASLKCLSFVGVAHDSSVPLFVFFSSGLSDSSKHESYTSAAISGAQDSLAESERGGEIRAASGVNISDNLRFL